MGEHRGRKVAVKVLRLYAMSNLDKVATVSHFLKFPTLPFKLLIPLLQRFCKEVMTWKSLSHPNLLPLLGVTMTSGHFAMVSEWMFNGSINHFIKTNRDVNRFKLVSVLPVFYLDWH